MLFSQPGRAWLDRLTLGESDRLMLAGHLRRIDQLQADLASVEKHLAEMSYPCQEVRLLMTLPGRGAAAAQGLWAALGDGRRFRDGDHAASYLGLVPPPPANRLLAADTARSPKRVTPTRAGF